MANMASVGYSIVDFSGGEPVVVLTKKDFDNFIEWAKTMPSENRPNFDILPISFSKVEADHG